MNETTVNYDEMIEALWTRHLMKQEDGQSHLDMVWDMHTTYDPITGEKNTDEAKAAVRREKELARLGNKLFADGYRLKQTPRFVRGLYRMADVPAEALAHRVVSAGFIATSEAQRVQYLIKLS